MTLSIGQSTQAYVDDLLSLSLHDPLYLKDQCKYSRMCLVHSELCRYFIFSSIIYLFISPQVVFTHSNFFILNTIILYLTALQLCEMLHKSITYPE